MLNSATANDLQPTRTPDTNANGSVDEFVKSVAPAAQRVAQRLNVPVEAVIGQWGLETGWGKSVIPGTNNLGNIKDFSGNGTAATDNMTGSRDKYRAYQSVEQFADDFSNLVGGGRYKNVPGSRDAQSYFRNLQAGGYAEDPNYANSGTRAAQMAANSLRASGTSPGGPSDGPSLRQAPKWADITTKPEFANLSPEKKAQAKAAYFDYWIAPHAGQNKDGLRQQFLSQQEAAPGLLDIPDPSRASTPELATTSKVPVNSLTKDAENQKWDMATAEQRKELEAQPGWRGILARERAGIFEQADRSKQGTPLDAVRRRVDPRLEVQRGLLTDVSQPLALDRTWNEAIDDTGVQLAEGVNTILGAVPNLIAPEGGTAEFFNDNAQFWRDKQSTALKDKINKADEYITAAGQDGVIAQVVAASSLYFSDPALAARFVTTNLPSMIPGIGAAKLAQASALARGASAARAAKLATTAAGGVNAVLNGGGARGEAFEDIKRTLISKGMSPQEAEQRAMEDSRVVAAVGAATGFLSGKIGLEKALVGGPGKGGLRAGAGALTKELVGEQLEEVGPKLTTNVQAAQYDNRSIGKDVGRTIVETAIGSGPGAIVAGGIEGYETPERQIAREIDRNVANAKFTNVDEAARAALNPNPGAIDPSLTARQEYDVGPSSPIMGDPGSAAPPLREPTLTQDGRIEPTLDGNQAAKPANPAGDSSVHPMVTQADDIVRELAKQAGIPESTVLPTKPQESAVADDAPSDQDVSDFANSRYQQLREKRDGARQTVMGENGPVDQDVPGTGLSPAEERELGGLESARGDMTALRSLYGFDQTQPTTTPGLGAAQENQNVQNDQQGQVDGIAPGADAINDDGITSGATSQQGPAGQAAAAQTGGQSGQQYEGVPAQDAVTESEDAREARLEREAIQGEDLPAQQPADDSDIPFDPVPSGNVEAKPAAPKTEKERNQQADYSAKWFGTAQKAQEFIAKKRIGDTHEAVQAGPSRFEIKLKEQQQNGTQAPQAQQAETQRPAQERGTERQVGSEPTFWTSKTPAERKWMLNASGLGKYTASTRWSRISAEDQAALIEQWGEKSPAATATPSAEKDAPYTRYNTGADSKAADRLQALGNLTPETKASIQSGVASLDSEMRELWADVLQRKLDKNGKLTWQDVPQELSNSVDTAEFSSIKEGLVANPQQVIDLIRGEQNKARAAEAVAPKTEKEAKAKRDEAPTVEEAKAEQAKKPQPGEPGYTLKIAEADLDAMLNNTGEFGRVENDRLTDRINRQEKLIAEMKAEQAAKPDDFDAMFDEVLAEEMAKDEAAKPKTEKAAKEKRETVLYEGKSGFVRDEESFQRRNLDLDKKPVSESSIELLGQETANMFAAASAKEAKESFDANGNFIGKNKYRAVISKYRGGVYMFNDLAEAKAFVDSYGQRTTPKQETRKRIGTGDRGQTIFENNQGIRSYRSSGFRYEEEPGKARTDDFKTVEELKSEQASQPKPKTEKEAAAQRTATESLTSAAKNTVAGLDAAIDGLGKLFGGPGRFNSGLTFDEQTYAKAKPLFQQAIANLKDAGSDMKEAMRTVVRMVLDKFGPQAAANMKPYVVRFIEETANQAQTKETKGTNDGDARRSDSGNGNGSVARTESVGPTVASDERTPVNLAGGNSDQVQGTGEGKQTSAKAQKSDGPTANGQRVSDGLSDGARQSQGKTANGQTAADAVASKSPAAVGAVDLFTPEGKFKVAQSLADFLIGDGSFKTIIEARKKISDMIGRPIEAATELAKQADEAIETAVVLAGREIVEAGRKQGRSPEVIYGRLVDLYNRQPNLAVRSSTSVRDQAYSTPVPLAYLASQLAGVTYNSKLIESTAGNGMLAIGAALNNATVNELNPKRAAMLTAIGFNPTTKNAATERLAPAKSQDAVVINPPFGATKDSSGSTIIYEVKPSFGTREVDHAIVYKTLEAMKDDGRAVLIVGGVQSEAEEARREDYRGKNKRAFYFNLYGDYNVIDHFTVDGSLYSKQGASYPVDVIVIDGRGKSARDLPAANLPQIIRSYDELKEKLNGPRSVESQGTGRTSGTDSSENQTGESDAPGLGGSPVGSRNQNGTGVGRPATSNAEGVPNAGPASGKQSTTSGRGVSEKQSDTQNTSQPSSDRQGTVPGERGGEKSGSTASNRGNRPVDVGGPSIVSGERVESGLNDRRGQEQETETQVAYAPHSGAASVGTLVPKAMRDAIDASIQKIEDQVGNIDQYVADSLALDPETVLSNFSAEQIDALALSIRNAEAGRGFIIGDQTGIGKGRVVAAMIRYAIVNDKTPVFVTEKPNLYSDMIRDLDDIGMTDELALDTKNPRIFITNGSEAVPYTLLRTVNGEVTETNLTLKAPKSGAALDKIMQQMTESESLGEYKVIFTTYSQLQTVKGKTTERQKFIQAFGTDNYMIFDESHNAGGGGETQARSKEQRQKVKDGESPTTGRASFVRGLVGRAFGTFFSSATYAKRPDVMDLYSSTNMKLAVDKISQLGEAIKQGGVPMQQVVANMLTSDGQYIRRERTFAGVSYDTKETKVDKQTAENMANAMRSILAFSRAKDSVISAMQKELDKQGDVIKQMGGESSSIQGANFGSIMHNLIDQMLLALKAQDSVAHAIERLKGGEKVVMTVSNTMGSFLQGYAEEMGLNMGDPVALSFKDLYDRYLEKQRMVTIKDGKGVKTQKRLTDQELGPKLTAQFEAIRKDIAEAGFGSAPISPIDYLHAELRKAGYKTEEITGRTVTLNYEKADSAEARSETQFSFETAEQGKEKTDWYSRYARMTSLDNKTAKEFSVGTVITYQKGGGGDKFVIVGKLKIDKSSDNVFFVAKNLTTGEVSVGTPPGSWLTGESMSLDKNYQAELDAFKKARDAVSQATPVLTSRSANIKQRVNAVRAFNNGDADVIILNQAGSTGLSLHAASKFKDQRKRHMIIVQAEKNIDTHMQMLGRVHRTGQVVAPAYSQMMADIPAEMRPAAVLLKKMASLNANTTASRKSSVTAEGVVDFMNDYGGQVAQEFLNDNPEVLDAIGGRKIIPLEDDSSEATEASIRKLTGYIPILPIKQQETIYRDLIDRYNELIERENTLGTNKLEAKAVDLDAEIVSSVRITEDKGDPSIFASPANMERVDVKRTVKPYTSAEVKDLIAERLDGKTADQIADALEKDLTERATAFAREKVSKMIADGADNVRIENQKGLMNLIFGHAKTVLQTYKIGDSISVKDKLGTVLYGVVIDVSNSGRTANPASGSGWKMQIALANGDSKTLTLNFAQVGSRYNLAQESQVQWYNSETQDMQTMSVPEVFDKGSTVRREKRWIVTGNILAGFSKYPGQIISYTKKDGTLGQGVMMSRQFDFEKEQRNQPVRIKNGMQVVQFLQTVGDGASVGTPDGMLRISYRGGLFITSVPSSKREGGTYFLDRDLTAALEGDFYKRGSVMVANNYYGDAIVKAIDYLIDQRNETIVALSQASKAKEMFGEGKKGQVGGDVPGVARASTGQAGSVTRAQGDAVVNRITAKYDESWGVKVQLFDDKSTLPADVIAEYETQFEGGQAPKGFFKDGAVYAVLSEHSSTADLEETILHEIEGHVAMRVLFGARWVESMGTIYGALGGFEGMVRMLGRTNPEARANLEKYRDAIAKMTQNGVELSKPLQTAMFTEEVMAQVAEQKPTLYKKILELIGAVREFLRKNGFAELATYGETDIARLLAIGRKNLQQTKVNNKSSIDVPTIWSWSDPVRNMQNKAIQFFGNQDINTFNWYDKSISTQYNKALKDKHFGKVFSLLLGMQNHISMASIRAAELAPGVMPRVDSFSEAAKEIVSKRNQAALDSASQAIFAGTLDGDNVMQGRVWTEDELRSRFGMDDTGVALYQQSRAAIDASLDEVAAAEAYAMAQSFVPKALRADVIDNPSNAEAALTTALKSQIKTMDQAIKAATTRGDEQQAKELAAARDGYKKTLRTVEKIFVTAKNLKAAGYAPLMRFGKFSVTVQAIDPATGNLERDDNGSAITMFFGRYETQSEARAAEAEVRAEYAGRDDVSISVGAVNDSKHELFKGVTPETLDLFAEAIGAKHAADEFIRLTRSDRSALKRKLERKGTPGFSTDLQRVMASFITSNARHSSQQLYAGAVNRAIKYIPKEKGDVQKEAQKLRDFVVNPDDAGSKVSSLMFAWFLGGSPAAAAVNMTQPVMMTLPYLSQYGATIAATEMTKAVPYAMGKKEITDADLRAGLRKASLEGVVDAQEIFHLYSMGSRQLAMGTKSQAAMAIWGSMFAAVEGLNRRLTFIAAWNMAKINGEKNPYAFAVRAVNQTQGIYNKVNRPNFARSSLGRFVFTFKQYGIAYGELAVRMWKSGPAGKRAVLIMLAILTLASGEEGLPGSKMLDDLIDTIGQMLGFNTSARLWKRRKAYDILGKEFGDMFLYGVSSHLPLDFGGRLGLGSIIPGTEMFKPSSGVFNPRALAEVLGPTVGAGMQIGDAVEAAQESNYKQAAINLAPKAVKDLASAAAMANRGYQTDIKGDKVVDTTATDAVVKAIGFNPTVVAQENRKTMPLQQRINFAKQKEASIVNQWSRAFTDNDEAGMDAALKRQDDWNEANPETQIKIDRAQLRNRARKMATDKDTRLLKAAPRELRGALGLDLAE